MPCVFPILALKTLALARAGYRHVQEMIGGFEYRAREGLAVRTAAGRTRLPVDPLTAPRP